MYRLIDYMAILGGGVFVGILAAYAAWQIWSETLQPLVSALGGV